MKIDDDRGYLMGWITAAIVSVFSVVVLGVHMIWSDSICTGAKDEQCVREWAAALGGWAAVPAAAVTVVFLSSQIASAERFHRENTRIARHHYHGLLRRVFFLTAEVVATCNTLDNVVENPEQGRQYQIYWVRYYIEILQKHFGSGRFQDLENQAGLVGGQSADTILTRMEHTRLKIDQIASLAAGTDEESWQGLLRDLVKLVVPEVREYCEKARDSCAELLAREGVGTTYAG